MFGCVYFLYCDTLQKKNIYIYTTTVSTITWKCIHVHVFTCMYIRILILTFTNMRFTYWHLKNYNYDFIRMHVERSLHSYHMYDYVWIELIWYITMRLFGAQDRQIKYVLYAAHRWNKWDIVRFYNPTMAE